MPKRMAISGFKSLLWLQISAFCSCELWEAAIMARVVGLPPTQSYCHHADSVPSPHVEGCPAPGATGIWSANQQMGALPHILCPHSSPCPSSQSVKGEVGSPYRNRHTEESIISRWRHIKCQGASDHQKLGEGHGADCPSEPPEGTTVAHTSTLDLQPPGCEMTDCYCFVVFCFLSTASLENPYVHHPSV